MFNGLQNRISEQVASKIYGKMTETPHEKTRSSVKDLIKNPDDFVLTAYVDDGEINIKFKRKEDYFKCTPRTTTNTSSRN